MHTKTPWEFTGVMLEADGQAIAYPIGNDREEDMNHIVRAVNSFEAMRDALKELVNRACMLPVDCSVDYANKEARLTCDAIDKARAALLLAEKGE